jgi:tRNA (cytidine/uridine-2'-O-)-methyltransferase
MPPQVVLVAPRIPQNTGNIARLTASIYAELHLIEPLVFSLDDKYLKRAGLDYWPEVKLSVHKSWEDFIKARSVKTEQLWLFTKKAEKSYLDVEYKDGDYLVFGNESTGLDPALHQQYASQLVRIPTQNPNVRSLNLSNSVSIGVFEAKRQIET